jgi:hypothetical protein
VAGFWIDQDMSFGQILLHSALRRIALQDPATLTAVVHSSSSPTVVTLCGIVTRAPRMLVRRKIDFRKSR